MAGRGQVSWLPGIGPPHLPGGSVSPPVADASRASGFLRPVTVAGPRRFHTGLPLTTDRMYAGESTPRRNLRLLLGVLGRLEGGEGDSHRNRLLARFGHAHVGVFLLLGEPIEESIDFGDHVFPAL